MVEFALLSISSFINVVLGLVVFLKNSKSATNKLFLLLTGSFALWSIVNYVSIHPAVFSQIVWVRLVLFCASFLCLSVYLTFTVFPSTVMTGRRKIRRLLIFYTAFVMLLTLTPIIFKADGHGKPTPSFGIPLFTLLVILTLGGGLLNLIRKFRRSRGSERNQLRIVLFGIAGSFGLIFLANFLLVVLFNYTRLLSFGATFSLIFSGSLAYAIVKHRLFDIRLIVARSLGYVLSIGFLATLYGFATLVLARALSGIARGTVIIQFINVILLAFAVLTYEPVKRFFERATNHIFYRDAYDPQTFLDQFNKVLVATVELEVLLRQSAALIEANLKANRCSFSLKNPDGDEMRVIAVKSPKLSAQEIEDLDNLTGAMNRKVVVADEIERSHGHLKTILDHNDIAVLVRLVESSSSANSIGYMILGPKKSGNPYSKQDAKTLEIIANELVIAIQNALRFEEIQEFAATLQEKVNEATRKLRHSNEKLKQLDETKDEFISMASHQLRTPLTSVKGYLSMVLEGDAGALNDMQHKLLDQAFVSSQRMVYLIADLLNVSRLKTGKFIIEAVPSNLADVVEGEVNQLLDTAKGRNLTLSYDKPENFPTLMLDETKIRQVIMNFTDNAIYYTPPGGHIKLSLVNKKDTVEFTVTDNGIGVPKAEQHHLFSKFYRAGNAKKARPDGTGLGLFMAQKVIVAQGGSIIFRSQEGKGSTFGFIFAKARLTPPLPVAPPAEPAAIA